MGREAKEDKLFTVNLFFKSIKIQRADHPPKIGSVHEKCFMLTGDYTRIYTEYIHAAQ